MTHHFPDDSGHGWLSPEEAEEICEQQMSALRERVAALEGIMELAYSEMAWAVQDIADPRRREDDHAWSEMRGARLAKAADSLRAALAKTGS